MKKFIYLLLSIAVFSCGKSVGETMLYVSPTGDDANIGSLEAPFATIEKAKLAIRELSAEEREKNITIYLRGGTHIVSETVIFGLEDSGNEGTTISYEAYMDETPIISSGISVQGWEKLKDYPSSLPEVAKGNVWVASIPEGIDRFYTMFDGETSIPTTHKEGFTFKDIKYEGAKSMNVRHDKDRYLLRKLEFEGGILKNWPNLEDIEVGFAPVPWTMNMLELESVDVEKGIAWTVLEANAPPAAKKSHTKPWVENVIDHLDTLGHWVVNTQERKIYYWPKDLLITF